MPFSDSLAAIALEDALLHIRVVVGMLKLQYPIPLTLILIYELALNGVNIWESI